MSQGGEQQWQHVKTQSLGEKTGLGAIQVRLFNDLAVRIKDLPECHGILQASFHARCELVTLEQVIVQ
jgi:hypothetical protein